MTYKHFFFLAPLILQFTETVYSAPAPKLIREIDLNGLIRESSDWRVSKHPVENIVFSPDDSWVAIGVGSHWKEGPIDPNSGLRRMSHLLVVPLKGKAVREGTLQIDVDRTLGVDSLRWSPGSESLAVNGSPSLVYAIPSGELWRPEGLTGEMYGFVGTGQLLALKPPVSSESDPFSRVQALRRAPLVLDTIDVGGRLLDEWTQPPRSLMQAVNSDRHLILATLPQPAGPCPSQDCSKTFVMDYPRKTVVHDWSPGLPGKPYFAEAGRTVCSVDMVGRNSDWAQCFDADSGKKVAEFNGFKGGDPAGVTTHASCIVVTHTRFFRGITEEFDTESNQDRVVWDFRANKVVAQWVPVTQTEEHYYNGLHEVRRWGPFAISPSGRYLAEGSNGLLRIYELP
jgi:hypothetical protein